MDLTSKTAIKQLLNKRGITPFRGLGQCFLADKATLREIIAAADLQPDDTVLEVGPGIGALTLALAQKAKMVIAVEKDPKLARILNDELRIMNIKNIEVVRGDILKTPDTKYQIQNTRYKIVANLPYYITSPVIRKFLETENPPEAMVLMVQKEVAQRICAKPPEMSLLAVSVQFYAKPEIISYVSKKSFWPQPKVDSAIIKISNIKYQKSKIETDLFFNIVCTGFAHPRKQLINNLSTPGKTSSTRFSLENPNVAKRVEVALPGAGLKLSREFIKKWLLENNVQPSQRPETLAVNDWVKLTNSLKT